MGTSEGGEERLGVATERREDDDEQEEERTRNVKDRSLSRFVGVIALRSILDPRFEARDGMDLNLISEGPLALSSIRNLRASEREGIVM